MSGTLTLSDTVGERSPTQVDSAPGIVSLLRGGDNIIACRAMQKDTVLTGIAVAFGAMIDTTKHYEPTAVKVKLPERQSGRPQQAQTGTDKPAAQQGAASGGTTVRDTTGSVRVSQPAAQDARDVRAGIERAQRRREKLDEQIREESLQVQKLQVMINAADVQIKMLEKEIAELREKLE
ncbi:MAG: hypothetical protein GF331_12950 [Chitinivibrionales bacterium]|nr:hypothetical protein [Chitinivibrionales bacterium]